jgi:2-(3-amino-3-carboxypropyl)histidine synthase
LKSSIFDLEEERLKAEIEKRGAKRVLIQLPEGLKPEGPRLAAVAEKTGALAIVSADPCYGACDLALQEAESLGADLIVHFGHSKMMLIPERVPVVYIEAKSTLSLKTAVKKALPLLEPWKYIGLITTVQHVGMLGEARETLLRAAKSVTVGDSGRFMCAGQVTGCDYSNAHAIAKDVEAFLFIGGGRFHAIGVALATSKSTVVADPYERRAFSVDADVQKIRKQRWSNIQKAMENERFGVIVGLKNEQRWLEKALQIRDRLEKAGKKTTLLALREVTPEALMEFPTLSVYVNTACPRVSLDDATRFQKPVLTINEALVVAGELTWEQLLKKGWFEG